MSLFSRAAMVQWWAENKPLARDVAFIAARYGDGVAAFFKFFQFMVLCVCECMHVLACCIALDMQEFVFPVS